MGEIIAFNNKSIDGLNKDSISLDRIMKYYIEKEEWIFRALSLDLKLKDSYNNDHFKNINSLKKILLLKDYSKEDINRYYDLIMDNYNNDSIVKEIQNVIKLTDFYLSMGDQISEFDEDDIKHYLKEIDKSENRRF